MADVLPKMRCLIVTKRVIWIATTIALFKLREVRQWSHIYLKLMDPFKRYELNDLRDHSGGHK
eukprot:6467824-Amphidinium_carterae.2